MKNTIVLVVGTIASVSFGLLTSQYISAQTPREVAPLTIIQRQDSPGSSMEVTKTRRSDGSVATRTVTTHSRSREEELRRNERVLIHDVPNKRVTEYYPKINLKMSHPMNPETVRVFEHLRTVPGPVDCGEDAELDPDLPFVFGYQVVRVVIERFGVECGPLTEQNGRTMDSKCINEVWLAPELNCTQLQMRETRIDTRTDAIDLQRDLLYTVAIEPETREYLFVIPADVDEGPPSELDRRMAEISSEPTASASLDPDKEQLRQERQRQRDALYHSLQ